MSSRIAGILDAVKTALNDAPEGTFISEFTAERVYVPLKDLEALEILQVLVVPKTREVSKLSRTEIQSDVQIDIGVMKRLTMQADPKTQEANEEIDRLLELTEQIVDHFGPGAYGGARWQNTTNPLMFDSESMKNNKTFLAVITLSFKLY